MVQVLLAGEQAPFLTALRQRLERMGMVARTCRSGDEVLRAQWASADDAVIADFRLIDMDATELCRALRGSGCQVPVLVHTDAMIGIEAILAYEAGADDYFERSLDFPVMEAKLRRALKRHEQYQGDRAAQSGVRPACEQASSTALDTREFTRFEERLFLVLSRARGDLVPVGVITEELWGRVRMEARALYEHVSTLRAKLRRHGFSVTNERGKGYRLESIAGACDEARALPVAPRRAEVGGVSPRAETLSGASGVGEANCRF